MNLVAGWTAAAVAASFVLGACHSSEPSRYVGAYVVALRSVQADVRGNPPAGPLLVDAATLASFDSATVRALTMAGVVGACRWSTGGAVCVMPPDQERGLVAHVAPLQHLADGRVSLAVTVRGQAAPGDQTVIVGTPYRATIVLAPSNGAWRIVQKIKTGGPALRAA